MATKRLENIDGLRAIAALSVLAQHMFGDMLRHSGVENTILYPYVSTWVYNFDLGRFGVILFFLISGFVVPFSIKGENPLRRFAVSRFFRLYPALWLAIASLSILFWYRGNTPSASTILANMTMAPALFGKTWLSEIYWTLFIELVFYFIIAGLFAIKRLYDYRIIFALGVLLVASTTGPILVRINDIAVLPIQYIGLHVSFLFSGLLLRFSIIDKRRWAGLCAVCLLSLQLLAILSLSGFSLARGDGFILISPQAIIFAYIAAIFLFTTAAMTARPQSATLAATGQISYSIYLFHWLVCSIIYSQLPLTGEWHSLAIMMLCIVATLMVSWTVYTLIEKPMQRLGRYIINFSLRSRMEPVSIPN